MNDLFCVFEWCVDRWSFVDVIEWENRNRLREYTERRLSPTQVEMVPNRLVVYWSMATGVTVYSFAPPAAYPEWVDPSVAAEVAQRALDVGCCCGDSIRSKVVAKVRQLYGSK